MLQLVYDYLQLRNAFKDVPNFKDIRVTIPELSSILFCSPKNAKLIIYKLRDIQWLAFTPGGGRGRVSTIQFLVPSEELILCEAKELSLKGDLPAAFSLIRKYGEDLEVKRHFMDWFSNYVQFSIETKDDRQIETLLIPIYAPLHILDPAKAFYSFDSQIVKQVFSTLLNYDHIRDEFADGLAHTWEQNADGTEWLFYLRKGVYFHNNKEFISDDVVYTFQRYLHAQTVFPQAWMFKDLIAVEAVGRYAVRFVLMRQNSLFLRILSFIAASILPADSQFDQKTDEIIPVGTGPYKVAEYSSEHCVLQAFPSYYQGRPHIDQIEIRTAQGVQYQEHKAIENARTAIHNHNNSEPIARINGEGLIAGSSFLTFNLNKVGPQSDERFRRAFGILLDRQRMIEELGETRILPSTGFLYNPKKSIQSTPEMEEAIDLLNQIKYQGEPFHLCTSLRHKDDAYWIQNWLGRYGLKIEISIIDTKDFDQYKQTVINADGILVEAILSDEELSMIELYQYSNSWLRWYLNPATLKMVDSKLRQVFTEPSKLKRSKYLDQLESTLRSKHFIQFLVHKKGDEQNHLEIRGIESIQKGFVEFKDLWIQSS